LKIDFFLSGLTCHRDEGKFRAISNAFPESLFVWLVADGWYWFVLREKYCWLVADGWFVLREKYCWLVADKTSEQAAALRWSCVNLQLQSCFSEMEHCQTREEEKMRKLGRVHNTTLALVPRRTKRPVFTLKKN
jgi:hypothetical protein